MYSVLQFKFPHVADSERLEEDLALAIFAAECIYGRPRVRMETGYLFDEGGGTCLVDVRGEAGETAARIFTGLAAARFGEEFLSVTHLKPSS
jgi:hypothetical protein